MNRFVILAILISAIYTTVRRGPGAALVWVLLPCVMLLHEVKPLKISILPDFDAISAVSYGVLAGLLLVGRLPRLPWHVFDFFAIAIVVSLSMTSISQGSLWTVVSTIGNETLQWLVPYYMARHTFADPILRRQATIVLASCLLVVGALALIEMRLKPFFYSRSLDMFGVIRTTNKMVLKRFALFRAQTSMAHPIDLGNVGVLAATVLVALAKTSGITLKKWWMIGALISCGFCVLGSLSFTSFSMAAAAMLIYVVLRYFPRSENFLLPGAIAAVLAAIFITGWLLTYDYLGARSKTDDTAIESSFLIRIEIIQKSWVFAETAGFFGHGDNISKRELQLDSVDNSYMLFIMKRGWIYLSIWLIQILTIAFIGYRMLLVARTPFLRIPAAAAVTGLLATFVAMYTVWFGFAYSILFLLLLGMTATMSQILTGKVSATVAQPVLPRGFDVVMPSRRPVRMA